jgi:hypothetical protein
MLVVASLFARSTPFLATDDSSSSATLLGEDARAVAVAFPAMPVAQVAESGQLPKPPAGTPEGDLSTEGLDDFPSEFDVQSWRKAG